MAFSFTGDLGCEFGGGVSCYGRKSGGPKQSFIGYMLYNRAWFKKDTYGLTIGGGQINNPGRYLVLLPPINGETAPSAAINAPYFTGNPGDPFKAWDTSITFDYMPRQWLTFRWEYDYRHATWFGWSALYQQRVSPILCLQRREYVRGTDPERSANCLWSTRQHRVVPRSAQRPVDDQPRHPG